MQMLKQSKMIRREEFQRSFGLRSNHLFHLIHYTKMFNQLNSKALTCITKIATAAAVNTKITKTTNPKFYLQTSRLKQKFTYQNQGKN